MIRFRDRNAKPGKSHGYQLLTSYTDCEFTSINLFAALRWYEDKHHRKVHTGVNSSASQVLPLKPLQIQGWDLRRFAQWAVKIKHKRSLGGHIPNCCSWLSALKRQQEFLCYWKFTITHLHLHARSTGTEGGIFSAHPISNTTVRAELLLVDDLL